MEEEIYIAYNCAHCKEEWEVELYYKIDNVPTAPTLCPLCSMSTLEMLKEVYEKEGIKGATVQLFKRLFLRLK